jgi:Ca2+-binding EF-hand superfamily protein
MGLNAEFVFKRLDVNEDGLVTAEEFRRSPGMDDTEKAAGTVARLDANGDGVLSREELQGAYEKRHAHCKKPDRAVEPAPEGRGGDGTRFAQVFIMRSDRNGDGKIEPSEFRGGAGGFQRLDKNGDGFIVAGELGELQQRRLRDPKTMKQRLEEGETPPLRDKKAAKDARP